MRLILYPKSLFWNEENWFISDQAAALIISKVVQVPKIKRKLVITGGNAMLCGDVDVSAPTTQAATQS
jgi:hypothetical protein